MRSCCRHEKGFWGTGSLGCGYGSKRFRGDLSRSVSNRCAELPTASAWVGNGRKPLSRATNPESRYSGCSALLDSKAKWRQSDARAFQVVPDAYEDFAASATSLRRQRSLWDELPRGRAEGRLPRGPRKSAMRKPAIREQVEELRDASDEERFLARI